MSVIATINRLPVLHTDADVNKPDEPEADELRVDFDLQDEMPGCCGITILGRADDEETRTRETDSGLPARYKDAIVEALNDYGDDDKGLLVYSVNDNQKTEHAALQEAGFEAMAIFRNPNSGNRVTLYGKLINQPRQRPVKAKKKARR